MKKVEELIAAYDLEATRKEDVVIRAKLKLIKGLYEEVENSEDRIFMDEIIGAFCEIIDIQREVIGEYMYEEAAAAGFGPVQHNSVSAYTPQTEDFTEDKQLQADFTAYLTYRAEKPLSSYTINDYLSRMRNLWKSFCEANKAGELPEELRVEDSNILPGNPLLNVYNHMDELNCYISMKMACSDEKRNWANAQAALNKLGEFAVRFSDANPAHKNSSGAD